MGQSPSRRGSTAAIYVGEQARIINLYFAKLCHLTAINSVKLEAKAIIYKKRKGRRISLKRSEREIRRQNIVFPPLFLKKRAGYGAEPHNI